MSDDVRRCIRKAAIGFACVCLLDFTLGGASRHLFFAQRSGKFHRIDTAMESANQRVVVFGSSHAASHYVPEVLEEQLGMSCYNAGVLGQQILFHRTLQSILLQRTAPDVIILDVDPSTLYESSEAYNRLAELRPFYFRHPDIIGPVLRHRSLLEETFLQSRLYRYNSTIVHVIRYAVFPQPDWNGYRPDYGVMDTPTAEEERNEVAVSRSFRANRELDPVMVDAMVRFAADARRKRVRVFYFVSPGALPYDLDGNASFRKAVDIADEAGIPFVNFRNHPGFLRQYALFANSGHLNDAGARRYSRLVADTINTQLAARAFKLD